MRFLGTTTIVGPIVLVILTIWIWFAFGTRAHAWTDNWRPLSTRLAVDTAGLKPDWDMRPREPGHHAHELVAAQRHAPSSKQYRAQAAQLVADKPYQQQFQPPTATELWQLRGACADLGKKKLNELRSERYPRYNYSYSVNSRYDPADNRCYLYLDTRSPRHNNGVGLQEKDLYDGQTDELLARVTFSNEGHLIFGRVWDSRHVLAPMTDKPGTNSDEFRRLLAKRNRQEKQDALDYINEKMAKPRNDALCDLDKELEKEQWPDPKIRLPGITPAVECRDSMPDAQR